MSSTPSTNELVILGAPVALRDGSHVRVRQGHRSDKQLLLRGFERLSPESRYRRFLAPMPQLTEAMVRYLTEVDHHDHEAIIALEEETGEGIGVVRYVRSTEPRAAAEFAVTVIDDWQRRGLGTLLLEVISARAREERITTFTAHFECPDAIAFGPLPMTSTGKVQKFVLREPESAGHESRINELTAANPAPANARSRSLRTGALPPAPSRRIRTSEHSTALERAVRDVHL